MGQHVYVNLLPSSRTLCVTLFEIRRAPGLWFVHGRHTVDLHDGKRCTWAVTAEVTATGPIAELDHGMGSVGIPTTSPTVYIES